ncbi:flavin reductase family protein [Aliidiomarina quisquiliarum]|uniref:flavin reductase family protein n=1 Tax=Aliidiomarina quisquiliarum TaxID=2938947 RepID=UPI00208F79D4|nr:flavin reductase family protein [Aliidiomarina quisquiliarum]MCO4320633.1 flavin reductase family protein [Aliidiomarina quisquiliarum]
MILEFKNLTKNEIYHTVTQTLVPRPIAWVLSTHTDGHFNLAPFSYFTAVSSTPPLLMFSVDAKAPGLSKDTAVNIKQSPYFVVHIASASQAEAVNETSRTLPAEESELNNIDIPLTDFAGFPLPRLRGVPIAFGCKLHSTQQIEGTLQTLVFGEIEQVYIDDKCATVTEYVDKTGRQRSRLTVDATQLDPLSRLGAGEFGTLGQIKTVARPR